MCSSNITQNQTSEQVQNSAPPLESGTNSKNNTINKKFSIWKYDIENPVYDHACNAMQTRPDYPQIERLWSALDVRFKAQKYDYDPVVDEDPMYQIDLSELSMEADIDDEETFSHLHTMWGAGLLRGVITDQEYNQVSVKIAPHMVAKS